MLVFFSAVEQNLTNHVRAVTNTHRVVRWIEENAARILARLLLLRIQKRVHRLIVLLVDATLDEIAAADEATCRLNAIKRARFRPLRDHLVLGVLLERSRIEVRMTATYRSHCFYEFAPMLFKLKTKKTNQLSMIYLRACVV